MARRAESFCGGCAFAGGLVNFLGDFFGGRRGDPADWPQLQLYKPFRFDPAGLHMKVAMDKVLAESLVRVSLQLVTQPRSTTAAAAANLNRSSIRAIVNRWWVGFTEADRWRMPYPALVRRE